MMGLLARNCARSRLCHGKVLERALIRETLIAFRQRRQRRSGLSSSGTINDYDRPEIFLVEFILRFAIDRGFSN